MKSAFLDGEGDAWFARNEASFGATDDELERALQSLQVSPRRILEIGCSNGYRLEKMRTRFNADCFGIDPSSHAIASGKISYPGLSLGVGTADTLPFSDAAFDLVIFGFCLYLCDPVDYFEIVSEANRVLSDPGWLVIHDFLTLSPRRRQYSHLPGIFSHKMEFSRLFTGNPAYRLLARRYLEHTMEHSFDPDDAVSIDILRKDATRMFK